MCSIDFNLLQDSDVHNTKNTKSFQLHAANVLTACEAQVDAEEDTIGTFCLLPPTSRLRDSCSVYRNHLFEEVLDGKYKTLQSLPKVWDTVPVPEGDISQEWITKEDNANMYSDHSDNAVGYNGLQPLPPFECLAITNNQQRLIGVYKQELYVTDSTTGLVERVSLNNSVHDNNSGSAFVSSCAVSANGEVAVAMLKGQLFIAYSLPSTNTSYEWKQQFPPPDFFTPNKARCTLMKFVQPQTTIIPMLIVLWEGESTAQYNNERLILGLTYRGSPLVLQQIVYLGLDSSDASVSAAFVAISDDATNTAIVGLNDPVQQTINIRSFSTLLQPQSPIPNIIINNAPKWTVARPVFSPPIPVPVFQQTVCRTTTSPSNEAVLTIFASMYSQIVEFRLNVDNNNDMGECKIWPAAAGQLCENVHMSQYAFIANNGQLFYSKGTNIPVWMPNLTLDGTMNIAAVSLHPTQVCFAFQPNETRLWLKLGTRFIHNDISSTLFGTNFTSAKGANLYVSSQPQVSDYGFLQNQEIEHPHITWFFGYTDFDSEASFRIKPGTEIRSPHEYYRVALSSIVEPRSSAYFAHVTSKLQQVNLFGFLIPGRQVRVYDNGNVSIFTNATEQTLILWSRHTTDRWYENGENIQYTGFVVKTLHSLSTTPIISPNGLYLFLMDDNTRTACLFINVYNSAAFAEYCAFSPERLSRAIARQQDFCFNQLQINIHDENNDLEGLPVDSQTHFADRRCTCIGGQRFGDMFTKNSSIPGVSRARFIDNLPCMLNSCQDTIASPEVTNVYFAVQKTCQDADLTICSALITTQNTNSALTLNQGIIHQVCDNGFAQCGADRPCPNGSTCVHGTCVPNCQSDADCLPNAHCTLGTCISPFVAHSSITMIKSLQIMTIVLGAIALLVLIALLVVVVRSSRQRHQLQKLSMTQAQTMYFYNKNFAHI